MGRRHICPSVWVATPPGSPQRGRPGAALLPSGAVAWPRGGVATGWPSAWGWGRDPAGRPAAPAAHGVSSQRGPRQGISRRRPPSPLCAKRSGFSGLTSGGFCCVKTCRPDTPSLLLPPGSASRGGGSGMPSAASAAPYRRLPCPEREHPKRVLGHPHPPSTRTSAHAPQAGPSACPRCRGRTPQPG